MKGILILLLTSAGGWLGWWLGDHAGLFVALTLSMVGSAAGLYYGRKLSDAYQ